MPNPPADLAPAPASPPRRSGAVKFVVLLILIGAGLSIVRFTPLYEYVRHPSLVKAKLDAFRIYWWAGPAFVGVYAAACLVGFPGTVITLAGALAFGPWWGMLWCVLGSNIGVNATFLMSRVLGKGWLDEKLKGGKLDALNESLAQRGFFRVLQLRLIPLVPFNFLNFACGLTKVRWRDYALGSVFGMLPGTAAFVFLSGAVSEALLSENDSPEKRNVKWMLVGLGIGLFILVSLIPAVAKMLRRRPSTPPAA